MSAFRRIADTIEGDGRPGVGVFRGLFAILVMLFIAVVPVSSLTSAPSPSQRPTEEIKRFLAKGRLEVLRNQYSEAIADFSRVLQMNPDPTTAAEAYGERGGVYVDTGVLDKAMSDAEAAVRLAPRYFRGYQVRGRVCRHRKELDRAIREFDTALQLAPTFAQLYNNRGNAYSDKGQQERAIQDYTEAIRRAPGALDGYVNRGGSYVAIGQFDKAITDLDQAIRIAPRDSDAYCNRALAYQGKREFGSAVADYERAQKLSPRDPAILNSIAWLRATCPVAAFRNGKAAVEASLEANRLTNWQDAGKIDSLAAAYAELGDFEQAIQHATKVLNMKIETSFRKEAEARIVLYRDRKAYHED